MSQDINVLALVKGEERYIFLFDDDNRSEALRTLGRYASNPDLSFTWYDAAVLSQKIRQNVEQPKRPASRFTLPMPSDPSHGAKALAKSIDAKFSRIQFTPDLLPADILGSSIYNPIKGDFKFSPGPIFCNILLADEINRASPRTQSALLEAMNENQATIEGHRYPLTKPFMVIATENPIEFHGTYPLPEAQLDRFLVRLAIGYPSVEVEIDILKSHAHDEPLDRIKPVLQLDKVRQIQKKVTDVHIDDSILEYIVEIVHATRNDNRLRLGISTRGTLMMSRAARARAFFQKRDFVIPDDVLWLVPHVLPHRILLTSKTLHSGTTPKAIVTDIVGRIKVPV